MAVTKKRYWTFIVYPESLPSDWLDILRSTGLEIAISPLHDKDVNPSGEAKKSHYHGILCFDGPTTQKNVQSILEPLNGPEPKPLDGVRGMYRYFTHKDNPEKAQYNESDILTLNGFAISSFVELSRFEVAETIKNIQAFIRDNNIIELCTLADTLLENEMQDEYSVLISHTYFLEKYITSRRNRMLRDGK